MKTNRARNKRQHKYLLCRLFYCIQTKNIVNKGLLLCYALLINQKKGNKMKDNKSWTELFLYSVYNRLCNFSSHKADISILLNARWQWVQDTGHDKQGYTK